VTRTKRLAVGVIALTALAASSFAVSASAQTDTTASSKDTTLKLISAFEKVGESPLAQPQYPDGVEMAIKDLKKKGITVDYERIPGSGVAVAPAETAFLAAAAKNPDVWLGLTASQLFAISPKVVASGIPTFAFASPGAGIKSGSQGGDNIFLVRPLNDSTAQKLTEYACKEQKLKKIGILAVNLPFGTDSTELAEEEAAKHKGCEIVTTQTNGFADTDLTQQVLAFKDAGVDGIVAFDYPNPFGVFVKQMQDNGLTIPILGGASLGLAVDSKAITDASKLVIIDDCVPALEKSKTAKAFVKAYEKEFGYTPNYVSGQGYDAVMLAAAAVQKVGHDPAAIQKEIASTSASPVCGFKNDKNNVLGSAVTVYKYNPDGSRKLLKKYPLEYIPAAEVQGAVTTTTAAPATSAP
jgi:ABC-type branched-subunit amino acid transport system substrate-binding protein